MVITLVQFPGTKKDIETAIKAGEASTSTYLGIDGLLYKYYLNGDQGGGGVYVWESKEKADAWFNDDWWPMMESRFGVRPTLTYFDNHVVVDNVLNEIRIDRSI